MDLVERRISELEEKRKALNQKLMDARNTGEANTIERELWAIRTAIAQYKSALNRGRPKRIDRIGDHNRDVHEPG